MNIGIICHNSEWRSREPKYFVELRAGFNALGFPVKVCQPDSGDTDGLDAIFAWNTSRREWWRDLRDRTRARGAQFFIMGRGWFDRLQYTQIDHAGFNHTASWAHKVSGAAPITGVERFKMLRERLSEPRPVQNRQGGHVLVLGQTDNDTQLQQSELRHPDTLCGFIKASTPGLDVVFRPHPLSKWRPNDMPVADGELRDALGGARFVVTINSNAGNDALWAGVPVLCFGPALYEIAGVARRTSVATLTHDMEMMKRWCPDPRRVTSYFHWLASRQWNQEELEQGDILARLLGG